MIIFVVLFVAAAVFAVMFFMKNEEYKKQADDAQDNLAQIASSMEVNQLKPLVKKSGSSVQVTAIKRITDDMRALGVAVAGEDIKSTPLAGIRLTAEKRLADVYEQLPNVLTNVDEAEAGRGLAAIMESLITERELWANRFIEAEMTLSQQNIEHQEQLDTLNKQLSEKDDALSKAAQAAQTSEKGYKGLAQDQSQRYENTIDELEKQITQSQRESRDFADALEAMRKDCATLKEQKDIYEKELQQYRPSPEMEIEALKPDGYVVQVVPRDKLAYINLGKADHIYRGLTFSVYDRYDPMPKGGFGKATLEVIEILDTISKCRITRFDETDPIMEQDLIASLVWAADKKYHFCVVGEFDLDGNGTPDAQGREKIAKMIEEWGGVVTDSVSVDTDFFVVGEAPAAVQQVADDYGVANNQAGNQQQDTLGKYQAARAEGAALGVPTFNLDRFLNFIGKK